MYSALQKKRLKRKRIKSLFVNKYISVLINDANQLTTGRTNNPYRIRRCKNMHLIGSTRHNPSPPSPTKSQLHTKCYTILNSYTVEFTKMVREMSSQLFMCRGIDRKCIQCNKQLRRNIPNPLRDFPCSSIIIICT